MIKNQINSYNIILLNFQWNNHKEMRKVFNYLIFLSTNFKINFLLKVVWWLLVSCVGMKLVFSF